MDIEKLKDKLQRIQHERDKFRHQAEQTLAVYVGRIQMLEELIRELEGKDLSGDNGELSEEE